MARKHQQDLSWISPQGLPKLPLMKESCLLIALMSHLLIFAAHSYAAEPGKVPVKAKLPAAATSNTPTVPRTENLPQKKQVIRFDALTISGEAKKPQVYYLLNRKRVKFGHKPVTWDLLPAIEDSVAGEPF